MPDKKWKDLSNLTIKEHKFVEALTNPDSKTYMNQGRSAEAVYDVNPLYARRLGSEVANRPRVAKALKEALAVPSIDDLITTGIFERLKDPSSRHWQATADFVAKIRGDFAPEKQIQVSLNPEDRDKKYQDILDLVEKKSKETE